jgi:hypothetical protein
MSKPTKEQIEKIKKLKAIKVNDHQIIRKDGNQRDSRTKSGANKA